MNLRDHLTQRIVELINTPGFRRRFLKGIKAHLSNNPVKSTAIEKAMDLSGPAVRDVVRGLRLGLFPIGSDQRGYYWCRRPDELEPTLEHLRARYKSLGFLIARMERTQEILKNGDSIQETLPL